MQKATGSNHWRGVNGKESSSLENMGIKEEGAKSF